MYSYQLQRVSHCHYPLSHSSVIFMTGYLQVQPVSVLAVSPSSPVNRPPTSIDDIDATCEFGFGLRIQNSFLYLLL